MNKEIRKAIIKRARLATRKALFFQMNLWVL